ncbi:MAG: BTAD domain-containing putative transcriptional regulator [Pseudomonadota bacterium]
MTTEISILGDFQLTVDGVAVAVSAQKTKALLAWFACHSDQAQSRDRLAGLLWADRSTANAKASLRQSLASLRKILPEGGLVSEGEYLSLDRDLVSCDVDGFRQWRNAVELPTLKQALSLYRGDLLDGFNARSAAFEEWLLLERETFRRDALAGFARLVESQRESHDLSAAIETAGRLLVLDPLQEEVHRALIQMYAEQGQLGSVQRQFKLCRDVLHKELGVPPSPETLALVRTLSATSGVAVAQPHQNRDGGSAPPASDRRAVLPNIAVLPFRTLSSVNDHEYLADGMTEELINLLANSANWRVTARNVSFQYRDQLADVRKVGAELSVGYVVEGSIRSMGSRVRISCALISTADGTQFWSERYDRPLDELFDVQDEVVHAIFLTLKNRLGFAERERVRRTPQTNLDAWGLLMKAMQVRVVDPKSHTYQLDLVREALRIEPTYPRAQAYLASLLFTAVGRGTSPNPAVDAAEARHHMEDALAAGSADVVVLKMCAGGLAAVGESKHALSLAERAFQMLGAPDALWVAVLMWNGRLEEAQHYCEAILDSVPPGLTLPPGELRPQALLGNILMLNGHLDEAMALTLQDQRENPGNFFSHVNVANLYGLLGQHEEAKTAWLLAKSIVPSLSVALFSKGYSRVFADKSLGERFSSGLIAAGLDQVG